MYKLKYKNGLERYKTYIPLHGHSSYSQGDGVSKINEIINKVKEIKSDSVGLTEHGNMSSFLKFYNECKLNNIKPIIGCELYVNDLYFNDNKKFLDIKRNKNEDMSNDEIGDKSTASNNHQIVYCKNYEGLKNLLNLSNMGFDNFYRKPLISNKMIFDTLNENNIVTTGCLASKFNQKILEKNYIDALKLIKRYKEKFDKDFYLEVHLNHLKEQKICNDFYKKVYEKTGIKPVLAIDYHYVNKEDWIIQYYLYVIKGRKSIKEYTEKDWFYDVRDLYIKSIDEIYDRAKKYNFDLKFLELAIDSTFEIRDNVNIEMPEYPNNFPKFNLNYETSEKQFMDKLKLKWDEKVKNGLIPSDKIKDYKERLSYELKIIIQKDFVDYFLILDDLLNNFVYKVGGATGAGRGSAAGSLVLFVLDITKIDPLKYNLIFERFLNPARVDPADVDLDIDSETQKKVEGYLKDKYGKERVCHIANFGKFGVKTSIKDLCRIFELDFDLSNRLTSYFNEIKTFQPVEDELKRARKIASAKGEKDLIKFIDDNYDKFVKFGNKFVGMVRQTGKHASGILLSNKNLNNSELPLLRLKGDIVTGVQEGGDEREVSDLGYCKLDILGLKTVSVINGTMKLIKENYGKSNIEEELLKSNLDDPKVYEEFKKGNSRDIFQFGSDNMINLIKLIQPENILDLTSINALFRPAVIQSGGIDAYLKNKNNLKEAKTILDKVHPELWDVLGESYGVPIFQEQIMFILQKIGGFTLAEADKGRKILKLLHKGMSNRLDKSFHDMMNKFKKQAIENGVNEKDASGLLNLLGKYSEYSFNKSHSLAYAVNAYFTMWLKIYYPKEYYATLFNYSTNAELSWFLKQAKSQNIKVTKFKFGETSDKFEIDDSNNHIKFGLNKVKGIPSKDISLFNNINNINTVYELTDFIVKNKISKKTIEALCRLNYFTEFLDNSKILELILIGSKKKKKRESLKEKISDIVKENIEINDWSESEYFAFEKKYFEFYFNEHPFIKNYKNYCEARPYFSKKTLIPKNVDNKFYHGKYTFCGIINNIIMKKSKKTGREYYKIIVEDDEKQIYVTVFNSNDIAHINNGDFVILQVSRNKFGFTKSQGSKIIIDNC